MCSASRIGMNFIILVIGVGFLLVPGPVQSASDKVLWLITPEEAMMAPASGKLESGPTQFSAASSLGPKIEVRKPPEGSSMPSPVEVDIKFMPKMNPVDPASLKVSVIKLIDIDITDRVRTYATEDGIHVPAAQLPSGKHTVRISIADRDGLRSAKDVTFEIIDGKP